MRFPGYAKLTAWVSHTPEAVLGPRSFESPSAFLTSAMTWPEASLASLGLALLCPMLLVLSASPALVTVLGRGCLESAGAAFALRSSEDVKRWWQPPCLCCPASSAVFQDTCFHQRAFTGNSSLLFFLQGKVCCPGKHQLQDQVGL